MEIPFNLLILPFLGGYIFVRFWNYTRIHTLRSDKERMLIRCSLAGFTSLATVWLLSLLGDWLLPCSSYSYCIPSIWREMFPFEYSGIAIVAFLVLAFGWIPLNKWKGSHRWPLHYIQSFEREAQINRAISEDADALELMLKRSADEGVAVAITMTNEKVYVGRVVHPFNPATPTNNVGLLPLQSGYRDPVTKQMYLEIDYSSTMETITEELDAASKKIEELGAVIEDAEAEPSAKSSTKESELERSKADFDRLERTMGLFSLVIPVGQIASAHIFDSDVHARYFSRKVATPTKSVAKRAPTKKPSTK